jgi:ubiquinone/menaquinone biosynthesis C-methylase UbiE
VEMPAGSDTQLTALATSEQVHVNRYFDAESAYWEEIYRAEGVQAEIYRARLDAILQWVRGLDLPPEASVLDVGCGAGLLACRLGNSGLRVDAVDAAASMVERARRRVEEAGLHERVKVQRADVTSLPFPSDTFALTTAVGVLPWLDARQAALVEMARVTRPGGYIILTADNRLRLNHLLDPRYHPWLAPLKRRARHLLLQLGRRAPQEVEPRFDAPHEIDRLVTASGLTLVATQTVGFGPFTMWGRPMAPAAFGVNVHRRLSRVAGSGFPILAGAGSHYLVLARTVSPCSPGEHESEHD